MPATSVRDLIIKDNDLIVATHGRGFWILDDISSLRQIDDRAGSQNMLFKPGLPYRVRWDANTDTPFPPDEPAGQNPPDGAIIDYYLKEKTPGEVTLDIFDTQGNLVRHYSSNDTLYKIPDVDIPLYWIRPQQILSTNAGSHRFLWDMHYTPLNLPATYPMSAIYKNTAPSPTSPWVMPGNYILKLTANGVTLSQPLTIKMDPRVETSKEELQEQHDLSMICYEGRKEITKISNETVSLHQQILNLQISVNGELADSLIQLDRKITNIGNANSEGRIENFNEVYDAFASLFNSLQESDMAPTPQSVNAGTRNQELMKKLEEKWIKLKTVEVENLNKKLKKDGLRPLEI